MPFKSKAQAGAMHAAEQGHSTIGIPQSVGAKFVRAGHGTSLKGLPAHVGEKAEERGEPKKGHAKEERREHKSQFTLKREKRRQHK